MSSEPPSIFPRTERLDPNAGRPAPRGEARTEQRIEQRREQRNEVRPEARQEVRPEARIGGGAKPQAEAKQEGRNEPKPSGGGKVMAEHGQVKPARDYPTRSATTLIDTLAFGFPVRWVAKGAFQKVDKQTYLSR